MPAHRPIGLPLQLAGAPGDRGQEVTAVRRVGPLDRAVGEVDAVDADLHDHPGHRMDRQDRRIASRPLGAQGRQDGGDDLLVALQYPQQRRVETASAVVVAGGGELVLEPEGVEKVAQHGVVVRRVALVRAEGVWDAAERLAQMGPQQLRVADVVGDLAQPVHVVAEGDQPRRPPGQGLVGVANPAGARDLAEGADMRQTGRAIAGLENRFGAFRCVQAFRDLARFLEWPGFGDGLDQQLGGRGHDRRKLWVGSGLVNRPRSL